MTRRANFEKRDYLEFVFPFNVVFLVKMFVGVKIKGKYFIFSPERLKIIEFNKVNNLNEWNF